jgi:hypothetical protein
MANRASNVTVLTEVGYCPFCARTRNLRHEERHLGGLVRTTIDCESCHRTLSSSIGPPAAKPEPKPEPIPEPEAAAATTDEKPAAKRASRPRAAASKRPSTASTAKKPAARKKQAGS